MKKLFLCGLMFGVLAFAALSPVHADIAMSMSFDEGSQVDSLTVDEGNPFVEVYLRFDSSDGARGTDAAATFTGFTYVIEATSTGPAVPVFVKADTELSAFLQGQNWSLVDQSAAGAENQLAGNANSVPGQSSVFNESVLMVRLDTSGLVGGDTVTFNPNLFDSAAVSNGANTFGGNGNYAFNNATLTVSAVPEPSSLALLMGLAIPVIARRRRKMSS